MDGERPKLPEGERPQKPGSEEIPEMPAEGEMPPMPEAKLVEEDIVVPEGDPMMKPEGEWMDLEKMPEGENVIEFEIKDGGNMFRVVTTAKSE